MDSFCAATPKIWGLNLLPLSQYTDTEPASPKAPGTLKVAAREPIVKTLALLDVGKQGVDGGGGVGDPGVCCSRRMPYHWNKEAVGGWIRRGEGGGVKGSMLKPAPQHLLLFSLV